MYHQLDISVGCFIVEWGQGNWCCARENILEGVNVVIKVK